MNKFAALLLVALLSACGSDAPDAGDNNGISQNKEPMAIATFGEYPATRKGDSVDLYHGAKVPDPYQWLENESETEVEEWVTTQRNFTENYLKQMPSRDRLKERLTEIWNYEKRSAPWKEGDHEFWYRNDGIQNHSVVYYKAGDKGPEQVFLDPNSFSEKGTAALTGMYFNESGSHCVYSVSKAGSDWREFYVKNVATGEVLEDHIEWVKFSGASWYGEGFYYSRYEAPKEGAEFSQKNQQPKVYYHALGTNPSDDAVIHSDPSNPEWSFGMEVHEKENFIFRYTHASTSGNMLEFTQANGNPANKLGKFKTIISGFDADFTPIEIVNGKFLVYTNADAPKYRLILVNPANPDKANWKELIPESENVLESVSVMNGKLVVKYLENVKSKLYIYTLDGDRQSEVELPGIGMVNGVTGKKDEDHFYFSFVDYTRPSSVYRYDFASETTDLYFEPKIDFASDEFETKQVWYASKDSTQIPMFITHRKGLVIDGNNPCFLFGYGGFNVSYTPEFRLDRTVFLENDGIYAVANLRGGGEFGEEWHEAGTKSQKQNVFDDFIAAAEFLIEDGYTNSEKLAIHGRSNGGLLVGACMTQRPDLFKVAIPKVGVLDMLKFHTFTIGKYWTEDYGCSENIGDFDYLMQYSPVHNVREAEYPATLVITGDHDDRVVPAHSYKFIGGLQAKQQGELPVLIRIDSEGGHGSGKPVSMQVAEFADTWAFVFYHLGMTAR
jgi:prolyl oligopeptidase